MASKEHMHKKWELCCVIALARHAVAPLVQLLLLLLPGGLPVDHTYTYTEPPTNSPTCPPTHPPTLRVCAQPFLLLRVCSSSAMCAFCDCIEWRVLRQVTCGCSSTWDGSLARRLLGVDKIRLAECS